MQMEYFCSEYPRDVWFIEWKHKDDLNSKKIYWEVNKHNMEMISSYSYTVNLTFFYTILA